MMPVLDIFRYSSRLFDKSRNYIMG